MSWRKSLSVDNIFEIVLIFSQLRIPAPSAASRAPPRHRRRARHARADDLGRRLSAPAFPLGDLSIAALLLFAAVRLLFGENTERRLVEESCAACTTWVAKIIPVTPMADGQRFLVRINGKLMATPMFVALILIETTDIIFALNSIPAVLAITRDPYIVYTSNIFALLGLRALYFVLADVVGRFHYLRPGLAAVLCFVACKMLLTGILEISTAASLGIIAAIVLIAIAASWVFPKQERIT